MTIRTPDVTLTGTFTDDTGATVSGTLTFTLVGYGGTVPKIAGTQMLPGLSFTTPVTNGVFSTTFYSNQIITPGPLVTFYTVTFQQSSATVNQVLNFAENYQFSPGTFDISQLTPLLHAVTGRVSPTFVAPNVFVAQPNVFLTGLLPSGDFTSATVTSSGGSGAVSAQVFNNNGTFTIPATKVKVTVTGGGGAGGGDTTPTIGYGSGGGAGGTAFKWLSGLTVSNTLSVTVGPGGVGVNGAGGNDGSSSQVASGSQIITTVIGSAGGGGNVGAGSGGGGGLPINGDINATGSPGQIANQLANSGSGGPSYWGGGGDGLAGISGSGAPGTAPGSGGGGGINNNPGNVPGGNGAKGIVVFEWV